jgi:hypothetical protein
MSGVMEFWILMMERRFAVGSWIYGVLFIYCFEFVHSNGESSRFEHGGI